MMEALVVVAVLSPLAGFALGVFLLARPSPAHERALEYLRECEALRHVVMDFVRRARREHQPTPAEWHALVEAVMHSGTPDAIRRALHAQQGTALPDETTPN